MAAKPRRVMKEFSISEISAVDSPAQKHARMAIMKRDDSSPENAELATALIKAMGIDEEAKTFDETYAESLLSQNLWPAMDALSTSIRSIVCDQSLPAADKRSSITETVNEFLGTVQRWFPDIVAELGKVLKADKSERDSTMADEVKKVADLEKQIADLQKAAEESKAALLKAEADKAMAETVAKFNADERAFYDKADAKGKTDFLADKPEDRMKKVSLAKSNDETFKMADGTEIKKSDVGAAAFTVMKSQEARFAKQAEEITKAREEAANARFEKRAADEMAHLPGTLAEKAATLKGLAAMPEEARKAAETMLAAAEKMAKAGFATIGTTGGREPVAGSAQAEIVAKAEEIRKSDAKLTSDQAMLKAIDANPALYDKMEAEKRQAAN